VTEPVVTEGLSESERRFDLLRRGVGLFSGPVALLLVLAWPMPELSPEAHRLAAIASLVVVWWITEAIPIPITAVLGAALACVFGVASPAAAFAPFADPIMFLFIGSFILSRAIVVHGVDARLAAAVLAIPVVGRSFMATFVAVTALVVLISAWMSNMVATAMMLPVLLAILRVEPRRTAADSRTMLIALAYAASIGGMITPVGAAPNLITIGLLDSLADTRITFLAWLAVGTPIALTMIALLLVVARTKLPLLRDTRTARHEQALAPGQWLPGQRNALIAFATTVLLWLMPGVLSAFAPGTALAEFFATRVNESVAAIVGATLLFVLPVDWSRRQFTISWPEASKIDWGTILLLGGGFSLGRMMFETGLAAHIAEGIIGMSGSNALWAITAVATLLGIILTEVTSNTAATSMLVPVVISVCLAAGVDPIAPALGTCLGASLAFMLPISTPSNAMVYGTGLVPLSAMIKLGILMDLLGFFVIQIGLWILVPLLGYGSA
jgi:sodium-dependent dicarboxylate transporter 2/3/5